MYAEIPARCSDTCDATRSYWVSALRFVLIASTAIAMAFAESAVGAADIAFDLRVVNGRVPEAMQRIRVHEGDRVMLRWTTDRPLLLHLHGYEIESRAQPGTEGKIEFTARLTGRFPIHAHDTGTRDRGPTHDESTLAYVEVYPR